MPGPAGAAESAERAAGLQCIAQGHALWATTGAVVTLPFYFALHAEALARAGQPALALAEVERALALVARHGERYYQPELLRLKGDLLLACGAGPTAAEPWLQQALASAQALQMRGMALKSALSLARLWLADGSGGERGLAVAASRAAALLNHTLDGLDEGQTTRDVQQARALLAHCKG